MKKNWIKLFFVTVLAGSLAVGCFEEDALNTDIDERSAQDNASSELNVARVFENVNNYGISEENGKKSGLFDPTVSVSWNVAHDVMTLTFSGDASGSINVAFNQAYPNYAMNGLTATITFNNYVNGGVGMNGTITFTMHQGIFGTAKPHFQMSASNWVTFTQGSQTYKWKGDRHFIWDSGYSLTSLPVFTDDVYKIYGNSQGQNANGGLFEVNIAEATPVTIDAACEHRLISGVMTLIDNPGADQISLSMDYSAGATASQVGQCDDYVLLTMVSNGTTITLKIRMNQ